MGEATDTASVSVNTNLAYRKDRYFRAELAVDNSVNPVWLGVTNVAVLPVGSGQYVVSNVTGHVFVPKTPEAFTYDADGNLTSDGRWNYTWDAENRLVKVESRSDTPSASWRRVDWAYDALGRRIRQTSYVLSNGVWVVTEDLKFVSDPVWFGRHVAELNGTNHALVRSYVWGLDLSETLDGAGGVGGLLWVNQHTGSSAGAHFCAYDGNGNVVWLVSASTGTETARYEYGPFGEAIRITGPMSKENPFRFSTKRPCDTIYLVFYEHRVYSPSTGRWSNRDPLGEHGGRNLYGFVGNSPLNQIDPTGLKGIGIIRALFDCGLSLLSNAIDKWLDQRLACAEVAKRSRHGSVPNPGEPDSYDIDLCQGFSIQPNTFTPTYDPKSLAAQLRDCIFRFLKGKAIEEALEEVTDETKRKILEALFTSASDFEATAEFTVTVHAKCNGPKAVAAVKYGMIAKAGGLSMTEEVKSLGPFRCPALDSECCSCKHNPWKEKQ